MSDADWTVPADHPAFAGHFPGRPIVPGVVLLDRAILLVGRPAAGVRIAAAKFFSPVSPGDIVHFTWRAKGAETAEVALTVAGRPVATATLQFPGEVP